MTIIDRTGQSKNKSASNRQRFLDRYKRQIRDAVSDSIYETGIKDIEGSHEISIDGINQPYFGHESDGLWETVYHGNDSHSTGDRIDRPKQNSGRGKGDPSEDGDPFEDEFTFTLSKEEFMELFFEGLALPNFVKKSLAVAKEFKSVRAGYKKEGPASTLNVLRSMKAALGRKIAHGSKAEKRLKYLLDLDFPSIEEQREIIELQKKLDAIPFIDPIDLRYSNRVQVVTPSKNAVMFCVMDVSGSMGEEEKEISKRFFILLYLFLTKSYDKVEIVFIKHHTEAFEVTEHEFFYSRESGGTIVSTALELTGDIIQERFPASDWNIYVSQASDGDSTYSDAIECKHILLNRIMPLVQGYFYLEITSGTTQALYDQYCLVAATQEHFALNTCSDVTTVWPVFRKFFSRET